MLKVHKWLETTVFDLCQMNSLQYRAAMICGCASCLQFF
ncbi:hypothetical protein EV05_0054 [Prochlorococcus sp. MIT 0601]|nr:hypothetical protein EV05_0054 [Prochlorococcus sp. MIT 0601]